MSEYFKKWIELLIIVIIIIATAYGVIVLMPSAFPDCTAYEAIDGKPIYIEYQLKTN
jgi:hypothetical protein